MLKRFKGIRSKLFGPEKITMIASEYISRESYTHVDLGCFTRPRGADIGVDVKLPPTFPDSSEFIQCNLGFQKIPLESNFCELITAFDVLEHIPKMLWFESSTVQNSVVDIFNSEATETTGGMTVIKPAIFLMNEICRVLKPGGQFISHTPAIGRELNGSSINSLIPIHQDPTHVNVWTYLSFTSYFCPPIPFDPSLFQQQASNGIRTTFKAIPWGSYGRYPVEGFRYKVGHEGGYLTMVLEKL